MRLLAIVCLAWGCSAPTARFHLEGSVPPVGHPSFPSALYQTTGAKLRSGHQWQLVQNGQVFDAIVDDIARAKRSIHIMTYIWQPGEPSEQLLKALANRDMRIVCRVLADPIGSPDFEKEVAPRLASAGCEARLFRPVISGHLLPRNHRKIVVVDGAIGFVGGFGIRKDWVRGSGSSDPEWRDINIRLSGPSLHDLQRAFAQNWQEAGGTLLPATDFPAVSETGGAEVGIVTSSGAPLTNAERLTHLVITAAKKRLWIWNAYFVPNQVLLNLLVRKAKEGVDVRLLLPGDKNDVRLYQIRQRETYSKLLPAGVRIFEYVPTMMHGKTMIVDEELATIGSINLEDLSQTELEEDAAVFHDPALVSRLAEAWAEDMKNAREVRKP